MQASDSQCIIFSVRTCGMVHFRFFCTTHIGGMYAESISLSLSVVLRMDIFEKEACVQFTESYATAIRM